jgi:hypothetical protein
MRTTYPCVFKKPEAVNESHELYDDVVLVPADKASYNIVFVRENYYNEYILNKLGFDSTSGNSSTEFSLYFRCFLSFLKNQDQYGLPYLY